jgi:hypothetical protein
MVGANAGHDGADGIVGSSTTVRAFWRRAIQSQSMVQTNRRDLGNGKTMLKAFDALIMVGGQQLGGGAAGDQAVAHRRQPQAAALAALWLFKSVAPP